MLRPMGSDKGVSWQFRSYATEAAMEMGGHVKLRPYHLPHEAACGLKGIVESVLRLLVATPALNPKTLD